MSFGEEPEDKDNQDNHKTHELKPVKKCILPAPDKDDETQSSAK